MTLRRRLLLAPLLLVLYLSTHTEQVLATTLNINTSSRPAFTTVEHPDSIARCLTKISSTPNISGNAITSVTITSATPNTCADVALQLHVVDDDGGDSTGTLQELPLDAATFTVEVAGTANPEHHPQIQINLHTSEVSK